MNTLPKEIENLIIKKKEQLKYQDLINEFKDIIYKVKKYDVFWELKHKFTNPNTPFKKSYTSYYTIKNEGFTRNFFYNTKMLKSNCKTCVICRGYTRSEGYKIFNNFVVCKYCFLGRCKCKCKDINSETYYYSYKNCIFCEYIFDNEFYVNQN